MSFSSRLKEKEKEGIKESRDYRTRGSYAEKTEGAFSKRIAQKEKGNNIQKIPQPEKSIFSEISKPEISKIKSIQPVSSYLSGSASSSNNIPYAAAHQDQKMHQNIEQKTQDSTQKKWENAKKQYEMDKIGFQSGNRFINYSTIPQRSDYETGIKEGMDKPNLFSNEIYGLMDYLDPEKREVSKASKYNFTHMNEDEKNIYYYLNGRFGAEAAGNYIKSINRELNKRNIAAVEESAKELGKEHPVFSSVLDAAIAPVTAGAYPAVLAGQAVNTISGKYEPMDPNDKYLGQAAILEGLRAGVAENEGIKNVIPNQTAREFLVGTGMSIGENIARLPFGAYGLAAAAGSAGLSGTRDAAERGGTTGQAVASGAVNAAAEAFFEKFSLDGLERFKVSPGRGVKEFLKNVGKQAITEGSEETATEIVNTLSDAVIMKELSQYNQAYQEYKKAGADDGTAKREAFMGLLKNVGLAGLGGAISGGIMGGGSQALGNAGLSYYGSKIDQDYRDYADSIDTDPAHYVRPEDTREAQELQRAAQEYAELQRQGRYVPNRDKAEYDIRMNRFMDNLQRRSQEPVRPQNTDEMPVDDKTTIEPEITGTEPINHQITENHVMPESVSKTPESVPQSAQAAEDTNQSRAYKGAYGKYGGDALLDTYDGTVEVSVYNKAFGRAYDAGYHNMDLDMAEHSAIMSVLTDKQIKAAYRAGIQDYNADNKVIPQYTQGEVRNGGLGSVSELAGQDQRRVADYIGKKTGLKINLIDSMEDGATASYKSGEITIDVGSKDFNGAMSHELTHFIKEQVPKAYEAYQTTVVEAEMKASGRSWEDLIESYERRYAEAGQELTRQEVIEEIVADATQKFFNDPQFIDAVIKKDKKLAQRIIDFLTDIVDSIKNLIQTGSTRAAAKNLEENAKLYEEARDIWMYGLEKAGESYKSGQSRERSSVPSTSEKQSEVESSGIKFQLKEPVEETKELIAVHNLDETKLEKILKYDGIPMPSIAITKAEYGWNDFGDISIIFRKDSIDPSNKKNKVYGADAWTPMFPQIEYDVDSSIYQRAADRVKTVMSGKMPEYLIEQAEKFNRIESGKPEYNGIDGIIDTAEHNMGMKAAYLASKGITVQDRVKEVTVPDVDEGTAENYRSIAQSMPQDQMKAISEAVDNKISIKEAVTTYRDPIKALIKNRAINIGKSEAEAEKSADTILKTPFKAGSWLRRISNAYKYLQNGHQYKTEQIRDEQGINEEINGKVDEGGYRTWLRDLYEGIIIDEGVPNGKDPFTPNGNRRSFKQMHYSITPENIVKSMLTQGEDGKNIMGFMGVKTLRTAATQNMKSISDIHANSGRLQNFSVEEYTQREKNLNDRLYAVINDIVERSKSSNLMAVNHVGEIIQEVAGKRGNIEKKVRDTFSEYPNWKLSEENVKEIAGIINAVREMPVNMFEAKPERVVGYDEVAAAVIPTTSSEKVVDQLQSRGIEVVRYDPNVEGSRKEAVNTLKDVRFQLDDMDEATENRIEALIYANKSLQEAYDLLEQQFKLTSKDAVRLEDIRKVSKEFLKKYNSKYSQEILEKNLSKLYSYIRGSDQIDGKAVTEAATSIAKSILKQSQQMDTELTEQYRDFRKQIRDTKISITDQDKADLAAVGGYNSFRKQYFGKMKLGKDGISVDSLYQELQSQYPELFPEDITHPADELIAIASALDQTEPQVKNPYHADMDEMSYILGQDIMQAYFDVRSPRATFADKKEAQLQKVRWQYQQKMRGYKDDLKKQYQDALDQVRKEKIEESERLAESYRNLAEAERQEMKDYYKSKMEKVRNEKWQAIDAITRKHQIKTKSMRDRQQAQYDKKIILKEIKRLQNWLLKPTDSRHIPEGLRTYVAEFLNNIDYSTNDRTLMVKIGDDLVESTIKSQRTRAWEEVQGFFREILDHGGVYEDPQTGATTAVEVDPDMVSKLKDLIQKTKDIDKLDDLDVYTMRELKETVYSMKKMIMEVNSLKSNQKSREVSQLAEGIFEDLSKRGDRTEYSGAVFGTGDKLLNYDMLDPQTMFGLMGNNMKSLYDSLRTGLDKKTLKLKEAQDYIHGILKEQEITPRQLREWTGPDAKRKVFETSGGTIELSVAEVMSLYELDKRNQAKGHMYDKNGGIKREPKSQKASIKEKRFEPAKIVKNYRTVKVKPADVIKITSSLTEKQKILADAMQRFMGNQCAAWGNEVTMDMYGYQKFTARNYFPIVTDRDYISTKQGEAQNQKTTIKNMGITKSTTPHAHNPIIIQDIFDVYTQQVDKMSTYNAYVIPLSDLNKVFNYRDARDTVERISIKEEIDRAFGKKGNAYIDRLVQDINGGIIQDQGIADNLVAAWKTSAIAGNLRVAIQQPTAILRAMSEINPKYLLRGMITNTRKGQWKQMTNYAPIVLWKDWGFYKMDTSRQMKEVIFDTDSLLHRINNVAMIPAEMGDKIAWNRIWRACEFECMDKHKELKEGSEEFYQEVGRRFGEIIDRTQVVDSVLHRTQIMRSQNAAVKMATSFMAEPLKSYDMLYRAYANVKYKTPGASKAAAAATGAYVISTVATALAASVMDAMRDDDREKGFTEKYVDNVNGNLMEAAMLINNIPYAKDIWATLSGDTPVRSDMAGIQDLAYAIREIGKYKKGSSKYTPQYVALYAIEHVSKTFGTPLGNVIRDVRSIADTIVHASDRREQDYLWIKNKYSMKNQANLSLYTGMMIEAQRAGDLEFQNKVKRDLNKAGIENDKIISRISASIKGELVTDPRIDAAAQARIAFDTEAYRAAVEQLKQEGYAEKMISSAVSTRTKELTGKEEIDWEAEAETAADTLYDDILGNDADLENDKEKITYKPSYSSTDIIRSVEEIKEGDINSLKAFNAVAEDYYETKKKNGVKKKEAIGDLRSIITRKYKKEWISAYNSGNTAACEAIQNRLKHLKMNGSYLYSGKDWADWRKEAKEKKED